MTKKNKTVGCFTLLFLYVLFSMSNNYLLVIYAYMPTIICLSNQTNAKHTCLASVCKPFATESTATDVLLGPKEKQPLLFLRAQRLTASLESESSSLSMFLLPDGLSN